MTLVLTDAEAEALREMVEEWIGEGFTARPNDDQISIVRKLGLSRSACRPYEDEYAEAFE